MTTYEVGIVGAGVHGASAAFHLAARGVSTIVLEKGEVAGGPTGRSSAVCRAYYTNRFLAEVARASLDLLADMASHTGGRTASFRRTGALFLHGPDEVDEVRTSAATLAEIGTEVEVLEPDLLALRFPRFDPTGIGCAVFEPGAGYADPVDTTNALLGRARELGTELRARTEVVHIESLGTGGARLDLSDGSTVNVARLLLAAGPWTGGLAAQLGVELPLTVERHVVAMCSWGDAQRVPHAFADVPGGYYARPEGADQLLLGPLTPEPSIDDPDDVDADVHDDEVERLVAAVVGRLPTLDGLQPRGGWASLYDVSPDWQPVIDEIATGVFVDAGTSGHGFKLAPALGRHVADLVLGEPSPELEAFTADRFTRGLALSAGFGDARILG